MLEFKILEKWITDHGIPMVVLILVIFLVFKYFAKQIEHPSTTCTPEIKNLTKEIKDLGKKVDNHTEQVGACRQTLLTLKGFLSGVYFRNRGMDDD